MSSCRKSVGTNGRSDTDYNEGLPDEGLSSRLEGSRAGGIHGMCPGSSNQAPPKAHVPCPQAAEPPPLCRHCKNRLAYRPRGLCATCYFTPGVRDLYPADESNGSDSAGPVGKGYTSPVGRKIPRNLPLEPTAAMPGTPEKVEVLALRATMGVSLWHPLDAVEDRSDRSRGLDALVAKPGVQANGDGSLKCVD